MCSRLPQPFPAWLLSVSNRRFLPSDDFHNTGERLFAAALRQPNCEPGPSDQASSMPSPLRVIKPARVKNDSAAALVPPKPTIPLLRAAAKKCRACDLWKTGTQTVFGEGPS